MNPTHPQPEFRNKDLLELAQLDALGLLDEQERSAFEKAFKGAPSSIQQLVRDSQRLAADIEPWLPDAQPRASLRERAIAAVQAAIKSDQARPVVAGRLTSITPTLTRSTSVSPFWRAAAIGSVAAAVLLGMVTLKLYGDFQRVNDVVKSNALADAWIKEFGPRFERTLLSDQTQFVQFSSPTGAGTSGSAVLLMDAEAKSAHFFAKDLPPIEGGYSLALIGPDGNVVRTVARIDSATSRVVNQFADLKVAPGESFAVQTAGDQQTVLKSNNL